MKIFRILLHPNLVNNNRKETELIFFFYLWKPRQAKAMTEKEKQSFPVGINAILPQNQKSLSIKIEYLKNALNSATLHSLLMSRYLPFPACSRPIYAINKNYTNHILTKMLSQCRFSFIYIRNTKSTNQNNFQQLLRNLPQNTADLVYKYH